MAEGNVATMTRGAEVAPKQEPRIKPPVDIYENAEGLTILADLPGVSKESLNVEVQEGMLTLQATPSQNGQGKRVYQEFELVSYFRQFPLPKNVNPAGITAELRNGVLTIRLPKAEEAKPKRIEVQVG